MSAFAAHEGAAPLAISPRRSIAPDEVPRWIDMSTNETNSEGDPDIRASAASGSKHPGARPCRAGGVAPRGSP